MEWEGLYGETGAAFAVITLGGARGGGWVVASPPPRRRVASSRRVVGSSVAFARRRGWGWLACVVAFRVAFRGFFRGFAFRLCLAPAACLAAAPCRVRGGLRSASSCGLVVVWGVAPPGVIRAGAAPPPRPPPPTTGDTQ